MLLLLPVMDTWNFRLHGRILVMYRYPKFPEVISF